MSMPLSLQGDFLGDRSASRKQKALCIGSFILIAVTVKILWLSLQLVAFDARNGYLYAEQTDEYKYQIEAEAVANYLHTSNASFMGAHEAQREFRWTLHWGYPVMLGYVYYLFGSTEPNVGRGMNALLSAISAALGLLILLRLGCSPKFSFIALIPALFWPAINLFASTTLKESVIVFLMMLLLYLFVCVVMCPHKSWDLRGVILYIAIISLLVISIVFRALLPLSFVASLIITLVLVSDKKATALYAILGIAALTALFLIATPLGSVLGGMLTNRLFSVSIGTSRGMKIIFEAIRFFFNPLPGQATADFRVVENFTFFAKVVITLGALFFGLLAAVKRGYIPDKKQRTVIIFIFLYLITIAAGYSLNRESAMRYQQQLFLPLWLLCVIGIHLRARDSIVLAIIGSFLIFIAVPVYIGMGGA